MTKTFLIATVAALAITAPAQAQRGEGRKAERAEKAEERKAQAQARQQQARPQRQERVRVERPQRVERQRVQRAERPQRVERQRVQRAERPQRVERQRIQRAERPQRIERQRIQRAERPQRIERQRIQRAERPRRVERQRIQRAERPQRVERQRIERAERQRIQRVERPQRIERQARAIERRGDRQAAQQLRQQQRQAERFARTQDRFERRQERIAMRSAFRQQVADSRQLQRFQQPSISVGEPIRVAQVERDWFDDFATQRYNSFYGSSPDYFYDYNYDDGYLYRVNRESSLVAAMFPLLGGAFGVGQALPYGYHSYNVPFAYRSLYYDTPNYGFRYGDGAIYRVDPTSQLITAVVALLTGQNLGIGQRLPLGYDVYNVPYQYRSSYFDTDDMWYRYDDGYIYGVDPYSRMIQTMHPVSYGGYAVGYPVPSYASYGGYGAYGGYGGYGGYPGYSMPYGYQSLYYGQPGYNYHYANNAIYQVDPATQLISALVALVTGTQLGVGQMLPTGYDVYNVPYQYRSSYFDTDDSWYRYDDGYIYQVDPRTRLIQTAIPVAYDGYLVGQPVPAAYPGYAVPASYSGLYYDQPGYDYRYFDGGIYQIQPQTQVVVAPVALVTGHTLAVGQPLPMGYEVYNVPYQYRDRYYDDDRYMYRYADGHIYQVDPTTRLISAVIDAIV